ncbi:MAG: polysaccharide deacetylase family protein [Bacteroides sp.]|nr:polysaccharide deacetylase family protein [Bacteroides sp.]
MNYLYAPPYCLRIATKKSLCWKISTEEKKIFLTFDDGPTPEVTDKILKILRDHQAKATFFILGKNAQDNPRLIEAIHTGGHTLGSHGWDHLNGWKTPLDLYAENAGRFPMPHKEPLFRPPYGCITPAQIRDLRKRGFKIVMWSVLSRDYEPSLDQEKAFNKIVSLTRKGSILVFHDSVKAASNCLALLPRVLEHFAARGFAFEAMASGA